MGYKHQLTPQIAEYIKANYMSTTYKDMCKHIRTMGKQQPSYHTVRLWAKSLNCIRSYKDGMDIYRQKCVDRTGTTPPDSKSGLVRYKPDAKTKSQFIKPERLTWLQAGRETPGNHIITHIDSTKPLTVDNLVCISRSLYRAFKNTLMATNDPTLRDIILLQYLIQEKAKDATDRLRNTK